MAEQQNINDDVKILKLEILSKNLKQNWNLDTDLWNEEFPHDYRFEDTYLQLSFVLRDFNINELKHLNSITNLFDIKNYSHEMATLINNYIKSCADYINHELDGNTEEYFKKFNKNNNCFSYEKKIKDELKKYNIQTNFFIIEFNLFKTFQKRSKTMRIFFIFLRRKCAVSSTMKSSIKSNNLCFLCIMV